MNLTHGDLILKLSYLIFIEFRVKSSQVTAWIFIKIKRNTINNIIIRELELYS